MSTNKKVSDQPYQQHLATVAQNSAHGLYREEFEHDACGIGALAELNGIRSHQMLDDALSLLINLEHRGGVGLEKNTGDGAGVLFQIPHRFFRKESQKYGHLLPSEGKYAVAMVFLPQDEQGVHDAMRVFEDGCAQCGIPLLFWRDVPHDTHGIGDTALASMPTIKQAFLGRPEGCCKSRDEFEKELYLCRRTIEKTGDKNSALKDKIFYICSMSSRTIVYKGMLLATQMRGFYQDLADASTETSVALVHSRYSTNTMPAWERAHPNRYIIHNGEINTLRGNKNWVSAREPELYSPELQEDLQKVLPVISREGSDSAMLDNVVEFLHMNGRSIPRVMSMLIPEPWDHNSVLSQHRRALDEYQSMLTEAWDGPAAIAYTDGVVLGASLDRNGLRPVRYYVTKDDRLILSSEVGTLDVDPANILVSGNLGPGEMMVTDPSHGRVMFNDEVKDRFAHERPYREWIDSHLLKIDDVVCKYHNVDHAEDVEVDHDVDLKVRQVAHGYHYDNVQEAILPMAKNGKSPLASMGADVPPACLSKQDRRLYDYFNQLFAQVTNPPIDALRESFITSTLLYLGSHGNMLEDSRENCRLIKLETPLLTKEQFKALKDIKIQGFKAATLSATYPSNDGEHALAEALERLHEDAIAAIRDDANILIISDRASEGQTPIPSLLAVSSIHNHMLRCGVRTNADIVVETGDAITPHDFATLIGYSASGIYPYLAHETIDHFCKQGTISLDSNVAIENYNKAVVAGIVSVMSKMGISTMQGYHGAQVFEVLGLSEEVINEHFAGTVSRIGGLGVDDIQHECDMRQKRADEQKNSIAPSALTSSGITKWRPNGGEEHLINPTTITLLQTAARENDYDTFLEFSEAMHPEGRTVTLRDLLEFDFDNRTPVPLDEVEPASEIVKRFTTGAMSYGSISQEAHECLAIAMNRLGGKSNSGEGGEDVSRETILPNGDSKLSAIKQIASGRFGVTSRYLMSAKEIQIKMAQGAKPGEGGHLPGSKVWPWIAKTRRSTPGLSLISPPPHHDIYSIEDLAELIFDMKNANPTARISVKLVSEAGVGTIATGVAKGGAHKILISGNNGGTGAAPRDSIYHAGLPLELGLAEAQQTLLQNGLRSRVVVECDGKLVDGRDVAMTCLLGAEEFGFATMPLIAMGCLMQRDCQQDTCPVGIATQNSKLRCRFKGSPDNIVNYFMMVAQQMREYMAKLGFRTVEEMVGHPELLKQTAPVDSWKAKLVDLSPVTYAAKTEFCLSIPGADCRHSLEALAPEDALSGTLDATLLLPYTEEARKRLHTQQFTVDVANTNRCVGTMLGSQVTKDHPEGLPEDSLSVTCYGSAGNSFGAFIPCGLTLNVIGEANDYFGKGLSGGILTIHPHKSAAFKSDENVIAGNVAFYGATGGRAFVNGLAGQRFAVRNSGATLVVEGVGNNGCEYMTGGTVLILGEVGLNFAAGMSGGVAYVFDEQHTLESRCNHDLVDTEKPTDDDLKLIKELIAEHAKRTGSGRGIKMLYRFDRIAEDFVKVIPRDYRHIQEIIAEQKALGHGQEEAEERAFEIITGR